MLEKETITSGKLIKNKFKYTKDVLTADTAKKKQKIIDVLSEGSQLTLLATIIDQLAQQAGLDTPELALAREKFQEIKNILAE